MVLTLNSPKLALAFRAVRWGPTVITWAVLLLIAAFIGYSYIDNPKDGPYGVCYESRGRPIPCELQQKQGR